MTRCQHLPSDSDTLSNSESVTSREIDVFLSAESGYDVTFDYYAWILLLQVVEWIIPWRMAVTIPAGDTTGAITMLITDDGTEEANESVKIYFDNPANANTGAIDTTVFVIIDNDGKGIDGPGGVGNFSGEIDTAGSIPIFQMNLEDKMW